MAKVSPSVPSAALTTLGPFELEAFDALVQNRIAEFIDGEVEKKISRFAIWQSVGSSAATLVISMVIFSWSGWQLSSFLRDQATNSVKGIENDAQEKIKAAQSKALEIADSKVRDAVEAALARAEFVAQIDSGKKIIVEKLLSELAMSAKQIASVEAEVNVTLKLMRDVRLEAEKELAKVKADKSQLSQMHELLTTELANTAKHVEETQALFNRSKATAQRIKEVDLKLINSTLDLLAQKEVVKQLLGKIDEINERVGEVDKQVKDNGKRIADGVFERLIVGNTTIEDGKISVRNNQSQTNIVPGTVIAERINSPEYVGARISAELVDLPDPEIDRWRAGLWVGFVPRGGQREHRELTRRDDGLFFVDLVDKETIKQEK